MSATDQVPVKHVTIKGEAFETYEEDGLVWVQHPVWDTVVTGRTTLESAVRDIRDDLDILYDIYAREPDHALTPSAVRFRDWLIDMRSRPVDSRP